MVIQIDRSKFRGALLEDVWKKHNSKKPVDKTRYTPCDRHGSIDFIFFRESRLND